MRKATFLIVALAILVSAVYPPSAFADRSTYLYITYYGCDGTVMGYYMDDCGGGLSYGGYQGGAYMLVESDNCHFGGQYSYTWYEYEWEISRWVMLQGEPDWNSSSCM